MGVLVFLDVQAEALSGLEGIQEIPHFVLDYLFVVFERLGENITVFMWSLVNMHRLALIIEDVPKEQAGLSDFLGAKHDHSVVLLLL